MLDRGEDLKLSTAFDTQPVEGAISQAKSVRQWQADLRDEIVGAGALTMVIC